MSLDKKSTHVRLDPAVDSMLAVLADAGEKDKAELAASLLTKLIVGEFHALKIAASRMAGLGIEGIPGDSSNSPDSRRKSG